MLYLLFEIFVAAIFITDFSCVYDLQHVSCKYFKFKYYYEGSYDVFNFYEICVNTFLKLYLRYYPKYFTGIYIFI